MRCRNIVVTHQVTRNRSLTTLSVFLPQPQIKKHRKGHRPSLAAAPPLPKKPPDLKVLEKPPDLDLPEQKPLKLELELPVEEAPLSVLTQQQELPAPADQPVPKPRKRRRRNHHPPVLAPGDAGEVTVQETNPEETIA